MKQHDENIFAFEEDESKDFFLMGGHQKKNTRILKTHFIETLPMSGAKLSGLFPFALKAFTGRKDT
ncbi:MAG: hypothetical protein JEZ02_08655 [Desulfatibacillum sp.]|nr:hypothetical protein [Desulfatibacillum sp.]